MTLAYVAKLDLTRQKIDVGAQKIDSSTLITYRIVIARFSVKDKLEKIWFFEITFVLANINIEVVLEMFFLNLFNANIWVIKKELE